MKPPARGKVAGKAETTTVVPKVAPRRSAAVTAAPMPGKTAVLPPKGVRTATGPKPASSVKNSPRAAAADKPDADAKPVTQVAGATKTAGAAAKPPAKPAGVTSRPTAVDAKPPGDPVKPAAAAPTKSAQTSQRAVPTPAKPAVAPKVSGAKPPVAAKASSVPTTPVAEGAAKPAVGAVRAPTKAAPAKPSVAKDSSPAATGAPAAEAATPAAAAPEAASAIVKPTQASPVPPRPTAPSVPQSTIGRRPFTGFRSRPQNFSTTGPGLAEQQDAAPISPNSDMTAGSPGFSEAPPPKPERKPVDFKAGDHVVYPTHGVGTVQGIETMQAAGMSLQMIVVTFDENRMTLKVPIGKAASSGLRKLATGGAIQEALDTLKGRARIKRTMWSRRAQEYEAKINSGDPVAIAEVVRDLHRNAGQPDQSFSERQIYEQAMERLAAEVAAIDGTDKIAAHAKLLEHLKTV